MPKAARKHPHADRAPKGSTVPTPAQRRRASLMNNRNMRYVLSRATGEKHDRDCPFAAYIPDEDFDMTSEFPGWSSFCWRCTRKAVIREGLHPDLTKYLNRVIALFGKMNASSALLHTLFHELGGRIIRVEINRLYLKLREDTWVIESAKSRCLLYHNNYFVLNDNTRVLSSEFHLQRSAPIPFPELYEIITEYSWEKHVAARIEAALRRRLECVPNFVRLPGFSLFTDRYLAADFECSAERMLRRSKVSARLMCQGFFPNTKCTENVYRVGKWHRRKFLLVLEALKQRSVSLHRSDYADFCESRFGPKTPVSVPEATHALPPECPPGREK